MAQIIQSVRGMHDLLPSRSARWRELEQDLIRVLDRYGYSEIRTPILEPAELFERSIGEVTDIVSKEMYTLADRTGERLSLRPEGTAGCVRALLEQGMLARNPALRLWYLGPMFRYERPQKGRYRQFHQLGAETFGFPGPDIDAELILLAASLLKAVGLTDLRLELNSLGTPDSRVIYKTRLVAYLENHLEALDEDSKRRLTTNPLRILDSKNPALQEIISSAPALLDSLDEASRKHFEGLCACLDNAGLPYTINPRLVRGLDYYTKTVFEWKTEALGSQSAVCAGGRFDHLVEQLRGPATPAIGFAIGIERLFALADQIATNSANSALSSIPPDAYLISSGEESISAQLPALAEKLRNSIADLRLITNTGGGSLKSQLRQADRSGARFAFIFGISEMQSGTVILKDLRQGHSQRSLSLQALPATVSLL